MPPRVVMHADLDYFYAQCEENANPAFRGKPVVVCVYSGRTSDSGAVSTCNYDARKYGVKAGIPIVRAKKLLENTEAVFLPMNRPLYEAVSTRIMETLRTYADSFEQVGIDEAYLDVTERTEANYEHATRLAEEIKKDLRTRENTTCSIGIGPNKLIAKIASDQQKPDGLTVVSPVHVGPFLATLPVGRIPGVGTKSEEKLTEMKILTIADLSKVEPKTLVDTFGVAQGTHIFRSARGEDDEPVKEREQPTQFSRIATLKQNTREVSEIDPLLSELAKSVAEKLKEANMLCKSVAIIAILTDLTIHSRSKTLESPTNDAYAIITSAKGLMNDLLKSSPQTILRRIGVRVSGLSKQSGQTDIARFLQS